MTFRVVLDAAAFDTLDTPAGRRTWVLLLEAAERGADTYVPAVTLAEVCRGSRRTRRIESLLARERGGRRVRVVPTDERLAKLVGAILRDSGSGSELLGDAHVVAVCACSDTAVAVTGDPDDITRLAAAVPGTRVVTRTP